MIGKQISQKTSFLFSFVFIIFLVGIYTYLAHIQHKRNADDRTIPTWGQMRPAITFTSASSATAT